ncbi:MAG: glycosyltransferase family 2 protein [bacterium]|nr:glycosyltransferase family 2 protein [bacterium]
MSKNFVIILNYNGADYTIKCIDSLLKIPSLLKIVVVDNNSSDNSILLIKRKFPWIAVIKNDVNLGFAAGNNVGINYALRNGAGSVLLLNNDTLCLGSIKKLFENNGDIVGPVLEFKKANEMIYDLGGHVNWWLGRTTHEETDSKNNISRRKPDYISGAALLVKRNVFEKVGLLDERYFLYYEDADFCVRAKKAGFNVVLESHVYVHHVLGASLGRKNLFILYHNLRSNLIFIVKNLEWYKKPIGFVYWLCLVFKVFLNLFLGK